MKTRKGRILSVPYPQELNDIPQIVARKREGGEFAAMIIDAFDVMHEECDRRPLVMGIALHPYIVGWPHRFKHLARALEHIVGKAGDRVWLTTAGEIAAHAAALPSGHGAVMRVRILPLAEAAAHFPPRGALIGLDLGTKTIGVAVERSRPQAGDRRRRRSRARISPPTPSALLALAAERAASRLRARPADQHGRHRKARARNRRAPSPAISPN